jgi:hypothetical protein
VTVPGSGITIAELEVCGEPAAWSAAGFEVSDGTARVGTVALRLVGADAGGRIARWVLRGIGPEELDGLPTAGSEPGAPPDPAPEHPNGAVRLDHVVAFSPDLARTVGALEAAGLDLRRVREGPTPAGAHRQAFFRLGECILEVVEHPPGTPAASDTEAPARFYGLAFGVSDLDATVARLGALLREPRDAVQPGRRIATARREAGLGLPVAFMSL